MNKVLYITGVLCVLIVAVIFTVTTFAEPVVATAEKQEDFKQTYTVKEFYAVSESDSVGEKGETELEAGTNLPEPQNATESILEPSVAEPTGYFDVPLPNELQDCIFAECEKYDIPPAIVIAMIEKESSFDRYAIGDDGRSFGLMQIQPKWYISKMIDMDCTDLFDPYKNIRLGIAILGELKMQRNDIGWALTYYNSGSGGLNDYAMAVLARANEIKKCGA